MKKVIKIMFVAMMLVGVFGGCSVKKATASQIQDMDFGKKSKSNFMISVDFQKQNKEIEECKTDALEIFKQQIKSMLLDKDKIRYTKTSALISARKEQLASQTLKASSVSSIKYAQCMGVIDYQVANNLVEFIQRLDLYDYDFDKAESVKDFKRLIVDIAEDSIKESVKNTIINIGESELKVFYNSKLKNYLINNASNNKTIEYIKNILKEYGESL